MEKVGLIAAMASESNALLRMVRDTRRVRIGLQRGVVFQVGNRECTLVTSGMGIRQAGEAARILIEATHPDCLVSFGIAGAVREDLQIGDLIMAVRNASLENGSLGHFQPLAALSEATWNEVRHALRVDGINTYAGTAITTQGSQLVQPADELENPILEMETAGLFQTTQSFRIPLIVLRAISDGPAAPLPLDLGAVMDENSHLLVGKMIREVFKHPGILRRAGPMLRNSRIAADSTARAVMCALEQNTPLLDPSGTAANIP